MKSHWKTTIAAGVFVIGVGGSVAYNQFFAPYLNSEWVLVASTSLPANTPLIASDWKRVNMPKDLVSPGVVTNPGALQGMFTTQVMLPNQPFTGLAIQSSPFTITPGTEDFPIPSSWMVSVSPTIRQGDQVNILPIPSKSASAHKGQAKLVTLHHLLVLSVHASNNTEVTTPPPMVGTQTVGTRYNGSGTPSTVDVKVTTGQARMLTREVRNQDQFIIVGVSPTGNKGVSG